MAPVKIGGFDRIPREPNAVRIYKRSQNIMATARAAGGIAVGVSSRKSRGLRASGALQGCRAVLFSVCRWATGGFQ
jgi:hypothetical protein